MGRRVITVLGLIPEEELGATSFHEHLLCSPPSPYREKDPDLILDDEAAVTEEVRRFHLSGGRALVDFSTVDYGRNTAAAVRISKATGVHVVPVTGFNKGKYGGRFVAGKSPAQVAEGILREFTHGIEETGVKPGAVKAGTGLDSILPEEETMLRAAALVHRQTGVSVVTHTEAGSMALEQIAILTAEGVPTDRIVVGHIDRKLEWQYVKQIAETGVYFGFDQIGKEKYFPDRLRVDMIQRLVAAGHGKQILLGGDYARKSYLTAHGGGPGLPFLLWRFVPWLREVGLAEEAITDLIVRNPARSLAVNL